MSISDEIARRRTFAIISHPDAGKTTLTEKFLLYGNAIHLAGAVKDRKKQRATTSDWMELEKQRGIPIFTFMNKCDRPTRSPIALLDELEEVLGIQASPVVWPLGNGPSFRGVFDRRSKQVHLFERVPGGAYRAPVRVASLEDPVARAKL